MAGCSSWRRRAVRRRPWSLFAEGNEDQRYEGGGGGGGVRLGHTAIVSMTYIGPLVEFGMSGFYGDKKV